MLAEWRSTWRSQPRRVQKAINRALADGRAVEDPALAPLAMEAAARRLGWIATPGLEGQPRVVKGLAVTYVILAVLWLGTAVAGGDWFDWVQAVTWALIAAAWVLTNRRTRDRLERAHAANSRLLESRAGLVSTDR